MDHNPTCELRTKMQGKRMTKQRQIIFDLMKQQCGKHPHVMELYSLAKKKDPNINLSTLYRTLTEFKKADIVEELHLEEEHHHYEIKQAEQHQHFVCEKCGAITEFDLPAEQKIEKELAKVHGFKIKTIKMIASGLCKKCR
ncbi:transcriptional repressor [Candidatus Woesearchaeota archaeon]|nr:transcriptional repressor [Candidatus Woesearchaeota archaeon]